MTVWPVCKFTHLDETFTPAQVVPLDHPMVAARPDLFTAQPPTKPARATTPKE